MTSKFEAGYDDEDAHGELLARGEVYVCHECGSTEVSHAMWVELNTDTVRDPYGTWCYLSSGNSWCNGCDEHTKIELRSQTRKAPMD